VQRQRLSEAERTRILPSQMNYDNGN